MSAHSDAVAHLTGMHTMHPTTFGGLATHSLGWLDMLHDGIHQALGTPNHEEVAEMYNEIVWSTVTSTAQPAPSPLPVDERTCRNCGTEEKIHGRWRNAHGWWVRLACTHVQDDDEY